MRARQCVGFALLVGCHLIALLVLLAACGASSSPPVVGAPTATPPVPSGPAGPQPTPEAPAKASAAVTLTLWTTELFSPTQIITSGQILAQQVAVFEEVEPRVRVQFVLKKPYGKGGVLDYLLTTSTVVPDLLPDLAFIDVEELAAAVKAGLVQPLDGLVAPEVVADLFPFAREACTFDGRLYALQFLADLEHLVYYSDRVATPPRSWSAVLGTTGPYLFPAGGQSGLVNDAFLVQYLAVLAQPGSADSGQPFLEEGSLTAVLQFYRDGVSRGIFPAEIVSYHTADDTWRDYLAGKAAFAHVTAHRYLSERSQAQGSSAASIPAINGPGIPIGHGWALIVVTPDPSRQTAAGKFLARLMTPESNAAWNWAAKYLPTRRAALALWGDDPQYTAFIEQRLLEARPRPRLPNYTQTAAALQEAVAGVIAQTLTPEEAAARVLATSR